MNCKMYNLSELVKTNCCIDCGTNDKLREVVRKIGLPEGATQFYTGIWDTDTFVEIHSGKYTTYTGKHLNNPISLTSINIDL